MEEQYIQFKTKKQHRVCIYLSPIHFEFLKELSSIRFQGDISKTIFYLLSKYLRYLYQIKRIDIKRTLTIDYQPPTKEYKRYWINIQPTYWGNLYNLKFSLGYSMSFLIRIMLDWEMQDHNETNFNILIQKPVLNEHKSTSTPHSPLHIYAQGVRIYHTSRWVYLRLSGYSLGYSINFS